jgi:hypothetical protein
VNGPHRLPAPAAAVAQRRGEAGTSLAEATVAAAIAVTLGAVSVPALSGQRDALRAAGAARHMAALVHATRAEALGRGVHVALVFQSSGQDVRFATFTDGNYDGIRLADIAAGIDRQVSAWARITDQFPSVTFGFVPGVTDPDSGSTLTGSPLKLGGSGVLSFGPAGSATSGTLYLRGSGTQQYAIRLLGATGRSRLLRYIFTERRWIGM